MKCFQRISALLLVLILAVTAYAEGIDLTQEETVKKEKFWKEKNYRVFLSTAEKEFCIPGLQQGVIPQGMDFDPDSGLFYISGYFKGENAASVIIIVDAESGALKAWHRMYTPEQTAFSAHVGGIAVAGESLFISASSESENAYYIARISLEEACPEDNRDITVTSLLTVPVSPSFLNASGGYLWVGNFYYPKADYGLSAGIPLTTSSSDGEYGCYILGYPLSQIGEGIELPDPERILIAPDRIQGMTICENGDVILSQSYGRKNNSSLLVYHPDFQNPDLTLTSDSIEDVSAWILDSNIQQQVITAMPMTEALCNGPEDRVYVLFESGALYYQDGKNRTDHVWSLSRLGSAIAGVA